MNFWHLVRVLKTRWLMIILVVLVTVCVIPFAAPKPKVVYQAEVYMQPTQQVMSGGISTASQNGGTQAPDRGVILSNLIVLGKSGIVLEKAQEFLSWPVEKQMRECPGRRSWEFKTIPRIEIKGKPLSFNDWADVLEVAPVYDATVGKEGTTTDVIRMKIQMEDGEAAPYLANAVGYAFKEVYKEKSWEDTRKYASFLESGLDESRKKLSELQAQLTAYKSFSKVVAVDAETQTSLGALAALQGDLSQAEAEEREAEAALRDINAQLAVQPVTIATRLPGDLNPVVIKLKEQLAQAEGDLPQLAQRYKPAHPTYQAAVANIVQLKQRIVKEGSNYAPSTLNEIHQSLLKQRSDASYKLATARARARSLGASANQARGRIDNLTRAEPKLAELLRDYTQEEASYKLIADKLALTRIAEKETTRTGSILPLYWAPMPATGPIVLGPTRKILLIYGFVLSLILSVALAVWLDSIDNRMRNAADVEKLLELPVLGLTPKLTGRDGNLPKLTHMYPLSAMAESYKILRTNILFAMRDNPFKTLMVATGRPGQGATTTVCNLAIALAQIGKKIILIDADMRRPSLHKFFDVPNEAGLSTLLQGKGTLTDAFQTTDIENLILIPAGPQPLNPSELIGSVKMQELVKKLEEHCDLVMFDTPSTIVFSDGPMLASWIDAVIMIVSANQAPRGTETVTRDLLRRAKANILGVVVNRMNFENVDSCYYYSHYYSDSIPKPGSPELESGNGDEQVVSASKSAKPKAIPAPAVEVAEASEDNPFPD